MSVDLEDRIRQATGDPQHGLDFPQVRARAGQLRRRRLGAGTVAAAGLAAIAVVAVPALTGGGSGPTIAHDPAGSAPASAPSSDPRPDRTAGITVEDRMAAWQRAQAGESLNLPTDAWAQPSFEPLTPTYAAGWSSSAEDMLASVTQPNLNGDGLPSVLASPHIGPDGRLLVVPSSDTDKVLVVGADGVQHVVTLPMAGWTNAVWAPAGYWFLLTRSDETVAVHRIGDDGDVRSSDPVPGYEEGWGAILHVHGDEIWVSSGFDADPTRGPEATQLATDGGDTLVAALTWVPVDQSPLPTGGGELPGDGEGSYAVPVGDGAVIVSLEHQDGVDVDLTLLSYADESPVVSREHVATTAAGHVPQVHATVLVSHEDTVWATGFPDVATTPTGVVIDPSGTPWFTRITPDGYALTKLMPPTGSSG